jgi:spore germination protein GerM
MRRVGLLFVTCLLVACGIPVEAEPEMVGVEIAASPETESPTPGDLAAVPMYLVSNDSLVRVTRDLPSPPSVTSIFDSLLGGVTEPERSENLRTAIPPGTETLAVTEDGSVLRIDLSSEFAAVGGEEEILAVAQIVLTATSIEGVDLVAFRLEGVPTDVPVASGALSVDPVSAQDYESLLDE